MYILADVPAFPEAPQTVHAFLDKGIPTPSDPPPIFLDFKRLVSEQFYSYRAHLLRHESYGPELHFGKVWASSVGNQGRLRRFYVLVGICFQVGGSEPAGTPLCFGGSWTSFEGLVLLPMRLGRA